MDSNIPAGAAADAATNLSAASTSTDNSVTFTTGPTAVTIASARTTRTGKGVLLRWRTGTEVNLLGFHVYRRHGKSWRRLTRTLITAKRATSGASYRYLDKTAKRRVSYQYRLKAVPRKGKAIWFGPIRG